MHKKTSQLILDKKEILNLEEIKSSLTFANLEKISTARHSEYAAEKMADELLFYSENETHLRIPRNYSFFGNIIYRDTEVSSYIKIGKKVQGSLTSSISLRPFQSELLNQIDLLNTEDCVFEVPCGHGKTVMALYTTAIRKVSTIVLVPTNVLADQWLERVNTFLPGASVLRADSSKKKIAWENADILIITYSLVNSRTFEDSFYTSWGQVIIDEAHRVGAETYYPVLNMFPSKYRLALTATYRRRDGLEQVLKYHFGKVLKMGNQYKKPIVYKVKGTKLGVVLSLKKFKKIVPLIEDALSEMNLFYSIDRVQEFIEVERIKDFFEAFLEISKSLELSKQEYKQICYFLKSLETSKKKPSVSTLDSYAANSYHRIRWARFIIRKAVKAGRFPLVLSKRKEVLIFLQKLLSLDGIAAGVIISKSDKRNSNEEELKNAQVILGIMQLASEGLDIDDLDTLLLLHPISDPEQSFGRIRRYKEDKKQALVIIPHKEHRLYDGIIYRSYKIMQPNSEKIVEINSLDKIPF
jgi:superfamily II DNA or RNA helicase